MIEIEGYFNVTGALIRVSDPCYSKDVWCSGSFAALNGKWFAAITKVELDSWGERVSRLIVWHESIDPPLVQSTRWIRQTQVDVGDSQHPESCRRVRPRRGRLVLRNGGWIVSSVPDGG